MHDGEIPMRFVVVKPHGRAGLGNRLRSVRAGLTLAALTKRSLLLDYGENQAELAFLRPGLIKWDRLDLLERAPGQRRPLANNARGMNLRNVLGDQSVALVVSGWNHDPSQRWRENPKLRDVVDEAGLGRDADVASCGLRALFSPAPQLKVALADARRRAFDRPVFSIASAIHLRTNVEFETEYLQRHKRARHCTDVACWARVADILVGCARGLGETSSILVAADDTTVVEAAARHAKMHFASVGAPPQDHRHHSGLTRPAKQLETERDKGVDFGHGGALGPLVDLLLLASAHTFVGTAGSSFSEQALAWGGLDRPAKLFVTPFAKSFIGNHVGGSGDVASELPETAEAAYALCGGRGDGVASTASLVDGVEEGIASTAAGAEDVCSLHAATGMCKAHMPSWFHNAVTKRCEEFIYGGCGGTANRFASRAACEAACPPPAGDEFVAQKALMQDFLAGRVKELVLAEEQQPVPRRARRRRGRRPNMM
jgi:hypothetical protein